MQEKKNLLAGFPLVFLLKIRFQLVGAAGAISTWISYHP